MLKKELGAYYSVNNEMRWKNTQQFFVYILWNTETFATKTR